MKKMEAFAVLRIKDALEAFVPALRGAGIVMGAIALLCINTEVFRGVAIAALAAVSLFCVAKAAIFVSRAIIRGLGFSEPGLERMALGI